MLGWFVHKALVRLIYGSADLLSAGAAYLGYPHPCGKRTGRQTPFSKIVVGQFNWIVWYRKQKCLNLQGVAFKSSVSPS